MGLFGKIFELAADVVLLPVAVAKDVVTLGGSVTDEDAATPEQLGNIADSLGDLLD